MPPGAHPRARPRGYNPAAAVGAAAAGAAAVGGINNTFDVDDAMAAIIISVPGGRGSGWMAALPGRSRRAAGWRNKRICSFFSLALLPVFSVLAGKGPVSLSY